MFLLHPSVKSIIRGIVLWAPLWLGTTFAFGLIGAIYAFCLKQDQYLASQAILVRDEANATMMRLGRFESQTQMKAAQETIMEMSKNRQVIRDALTEVGPESGGWGIGQLSSIFGGGAKFPTDQQVDSFASSNVSVHAPKGVEFGNTEVIYLDVKANSQDRALALVKAVCKALDQRLRQVRQARAESVINELQTAKQAAQKELEGTTGRIQVMEKEAGALLPDLRSLTDANGVGAPRTQIDQIMGELRNAQAQLDQLLSDQRLLDEALADPGANVVAPGSLLNSQPGLKKLREGLADAQLNTSQLQGRFTDSHPLMIAARDAQSTIEKRLIDALGASKITLVQDIQTSQRRIEQLNRQKELADQRLDSLASIRTRYANFVSELKTRSTILEETERQLAEATASRESSQTVSLLSLLDLPQVGDKPIGPSRATLTVLCSIGGLLLGLGFVLAVTPIDGNLRFGRRWSDEMAIEKRTTSEDTSETQSTTEAPPKTTVVYTPKSETYPTTTAEQSLLRRLQADRTMNNDIRHVNDKLHPPKNRLAIENILADDADYETATERPQESVAREETILERLAKVQETFEDNQRALDSQVYKPNTAKPSADQTDSNERRTRPRVQEQAQATVQVAVRPKRV